MRKFIKGLLCAGVVLHSLPMISSAADSTALAMVHQEAESLYQKLRAVASGASIANSQTNETDDNDVTSQIESFLDQATSKWGPLVAIDTPLFVSDVEARIIIRLEKMSYELTVKATEDGEDVLVQLSNVASEEDLTGKSWADLGDDTLKVVSIENLNQFRDQFRADSGYVRLVSLLSPT